MGDIKLRIRRGLEQIRRGVVFGRRRILRRWREFLGRRKLRKLVIV